MGRFAIPHLMRYIVFGNALVYLIAMVYPEIVYFLNFMPTMILRGQVWRLFSFVFVPTLGSPFSAILSLFCYYWIGAALERTMGAFRFGMYYMVGWLAVIISGFALYFIFPGDPIALIYSQMSYFNQTLFISMATLFPNVGILMFFFIPLKAKWAGIISAAFIVVEFITAALPIKILILVSFLPYLLFFLPGFFKGLKDKNRRREFERKMAYGQNMREQAQRRQNAGPFRYNISNIEGKDPEAGKIIKQAFHRCCICGITEIDDPEMSFRYCSSCNGNFEYCENHIRNHEHKV